MSVPIVVSFTNIFLKRLSPAPRSYASSLSGTIEFFTVVTPPIVIVPPIVTLEVTSRPTSEALLNVNVSEISAVLVTSNSPAIVVFPVTSRVPPNVEAPVPTVNVLVSATLTLSFNVVTPVTSNVPPNVEAPPIPTVNDFV